MFCSGTGSHDITHQCVCGCMCCVCYREQVGVYIVLCIIFFVCCTKFIPVCCVHWLCLCMRVVCSVIYWEILTSCVHVRMRAS